MSVNALGAGCMPITLSDLYSFRSCRADINDPIARNNFSLDDKVDESVDVVVWIVEEIILDTLPRKIDQMTSPREKLEKN